MTRLLARALMEDHGSAEHAVDAHGSRRGVDRVLLATFWRPSDDHGLAPVISITARRVALRKPPVSG